MTWPQTHLVVEAFVPGAIRPAVIGFATSRLPSGCRLVGAGGVPSAKPIGGATTSQKLAEGGVTCGRPPAPAAPATG
jgi:hypothetical protein